MPSGRVKGTYKHSEETKQKIRLARLGKKTSEEHKRVFTHKGKKHSEEAKRKIGIAQMGKHHSKETRRKIGESQKGEKANNWQGGISFEPYSLDWTVTLRRSIRERDHYTCQLCGELQGDKAHAVHHIDYDKQNCNPDNLITLCNACNSKVNYNRELWKSYFEHKQKEG